MLRALLLSIFFVFAAQANAALNLATWDDLLKGAVNSGFVDYTQWRDNARFDQLVDQIAKEDTATMNVKQQLVPHQHDNYVSSWFVRVHGKARLEGNGHSPWREAQRSPWARTSQPAGRCCGVPPPRCSACQGLWPLPARCALQRNATATLDTQLSC